MMHVLVSKITTNGKKATQFLSYNLTGCRGQEIEWNIKARKEKRIK